MVSLYCNSHFVLKRTAFEKNDYRGYCFSDSVASILSPYSSPSDHQHFNDVKFIALVTVGFNVIVVEMR